MRHFMLDIETLSQHSDAAVFEVGIIEFDRDSNIQDYQRRCWTIEPTTGHIEPATIAWWMRQERIPDLQGSNELDAARNIHAFLSEITSYPDVRLWAKGPSFDCVILTNFLRRHGFEMPISFRDWRDVRTLMEVADWPELPSVPAGFVAHNTLDDCAEQIVAVRTCWSSLEKKAGTDV